MTWKRFWLGLIDAMLNSASSGVVVMLVDPADFNLNDGLYNVAKVAIAGALLGMALYFKNHRLPGVTDED